MTWSADVDENNVAWVLLNHDDHVIGEGVSLPVVVGNLVRHILSVDPDSDTLSTPGQWTYDPETNTVSYAADKKAQILLIQKVIEIRNAAQAAVVTQAKAELALDESLSQEVKDLISEL